MITLFETRVYKKQSSLPYKGRGKVCVRPISQNFTCGVIMSMLYKSRLAPRSFGSHASYTEIIVHGLIIVVVKELLMEQVVATMLSNNSSVMQQ